MHLCFLKALCLNQQPAAACKCPQTKSRMNPCSLFKHLMSNQRWRWNILHDELLVNLLILNSLDFFCPCKQDKYMLFLMVHHTHLVWWNSVSVFIFYIYFAVFGGKFNMPVTLCFRWVPSFCDKRDGKFFCLFLIFDKNANKIAWQTIKTQFLLCYIITFGGKKSCYSRRIKITKMPQSWLRYVLKKLFFLKCNIYIL